MKTLLNSRFLFFIIFLICTGALAGAFYLEYFENMLPCILCWVQRALFCFTGIVCLIACIHNPQAIGRRIYAFFALIFAGLGIIAASRQIWLKFNPDNFGCLPTTIEDIFNDNPFFQAILTAFHGTSECGLFQGSVLGIEITYWGLLLFSLFSLLLLFQLVRPNPTRLTTQ